MSMILPSPVPEVLAPGERLLWEGRAGGTLFPPGTATGAVSGAAFVAFAVFWELTAITGGAGWVFVLIGAAFLAGGVRALIWPPIERRLRALSTWYAVTDQRVLAIRRRKGGTLEVEAAFLRNIPGLTIRHGRHGRGSIYFQPSVTDVATDGKTGGLFGFVDIADPDVVARIVTGAMPADPAAAQS